MIKIFMSRRDSGEKPGDQTPSAPAANGTAKSFFGADFGDLLEQEGEGDILGEEDRDPEDVFLKNPSTPLPGSEPPSPTENHRMTLRRGAVPTSKEIERAAQKIQHEPFVEKPPLRSVGKRKSEDNTTRISKVKDEYGHRDKRLKSEDDPDSQDNGR